jgi:maltose alpha-D-glucosyltransferase/alpha-amylase
MDPIYGYPSINVEAQCRDPSSLLSWTKRMLAVRKTSQAFGRGTRRFLRPGNRKILAYLREYGEDSILCVANLSRSAQPVELNLPRSRAACPSKCWAARPFRRSATCPTCSRLSALRLLLVQADHRRRGAVVARTHLLDRRAPGAGAVRRLEQLVPRPGGAVAHRHGGENPAAIRDRRCLASSRRSAGMPRRARPSSARASSTMWCGRKAKSSWVVALLGSSAPRRSRSYFMPLALAWEERDEERVRNLIHLAIAKIRQQSSVGVMGDAFADEAFCRALVARWQAPRNRDRAGQARIPADGRLSSAQLAGANSLACRAARPQGSSSNTVVVMGERLILKGYRRLRAGASPELEMGLYLTEVVHFPIARRWRACCNTGQRREPNLCSRCCRPMSRIKATAGRIRSSICGVISRCIARHPPPTRCPPTRTRRISS